jgi:hypothetical protein
MFYPKRSTSSLKLQEDSYPHEVSISMMTYSSLKTTHLQYLYLMINYMCIYTHDYYVLDLSLLYYIIKNRGRYFDEMIN